MSKDLSTVSGGAQPPAKWNRSEVSRYLIPILKYCDAAAGDAAEEEVAAAENTARAAILSAPTAYGELLRVYRKGSDAAIDQWFGGIDCDDELLRDAFIYIEKTLHPGSTAQKTTAATQPQAAPAAQDYRLESVFRSLCRISEGGTSINLLAPFEEYYYCDATRCEDYEYRRVLIADQCRTLLQQYLNHYLRILDWYRTNITPPEDSTSLSSDPALRPETHLYAHLLEAWLARIDYEARIGEQIEQLEYERGGLGWFHRQRKAEIDHTIATLRVQQCKLRLEDATERYNAYCAPLNRKKDALQAELDRAPLTAFGRKKELRAKIAELIEKIEAYREQVGIDAISAEFTRLQKAARG